MFTAASNHEKMNWQTHDVPSQTFRHYSQISDRCFVGNSQGAQGTGRASAEKYRADFGIFSLFFVDK